MCVQCNDGTLSVAIQQLSEEIVQNNIAKGWEPDPKRTFGDEMALMHSEISEAFEAFRQWGLDDMTPPQTHQETCAPHKLDPACQCQVVPPKPEGVGSEFADVFIRLLHYSYVHDIDLIAETRRKMTYNKTRAYKHGNKKL